MDQERKTGITPKPLLDYPDDITPDQSWYVEAFYFLSDSRNNGMAMGAIPLSEIESYMRIFDIQDKERFVIVMKGMDREYIKSIGNK